MTPQNYWRIRNNSKSKQHLYILICDLCISTKNHTKLTNYFKYR